MRNLHILLAIVIAAVLLAPAPVRAQAAQLDGSWIVGEVDGDDFDIFLDMHGGSGKIGSRLPKGGMKPRRISIASVEKRLFTLSLDGQRPGNAWLLLQSDDQGLLWTSEHDSLLLVRRRAALPAALKGEWKVSDGSEAAVERAVLTDDLVTFTGKQGRTSMTAFPLVSAGSTIDLVLGNDQDEGRLHHFQPLPDGSFLLWRAESSEYKVLYRGDHLPAWVLLRKPKRTN